MIEMITVGALLIAGLFFENQLTDSPQTAVLGQTVPAHPPAASQPIKTEPDPLHPRLVLRGAAHAPTGTKLRSGKFRVWEDRAARKGRVLELDVVVLPALAKDPRPDPVFILVGGPGQSAADQVDRWVGHWFREERDLVLISQRGTGGDNRLRCDPPGDDEEPQTYLEPIFVEKNFRACLAALRARFDLTKYSTPIAMDDINDARQALGYQKINLFGGSYGSRAELEYIRRHGATVRCAILNSVAPVGFLNPLHHARSAQDALDAIFAECQADPACHKTFGDLPSKFKTVLARLDAQPATATVRHPKTGQPTPVKLARAAFAEALRVIMYYDSRGVPLLVQRAYEGDFDFVAQLALDSNRDLRRSLAMGMLLCVTCGEDVARIDPATIPQFTRDTFLGDARVRQQMAVCDFWPRSVLPDDCDDPVISDGPVLLLSGTLDPVTPPRWGAEAARTLPNGRHVIVPGSHGVEGPCVEAIVRDFLKHGNAETLDTSCVEAIRLPPFRLTSEAKPLP